MADRVMTAPLAIIKTASGKAIGKMRNIRVTETLRRSRVGGLGELTPQEYPAVEWNGSLTCSFYTIDLKKTGIPGLLNRETGSVEKFINSVLLQEDGIDIYIYKKEAQTIDSETGLVTEISEGDFAVIRGCFSDRQGFDISEGAISGSDQDMTYMHPILFPEAAQ